MSIAVQGATAKPAVSQRFHVPLDLTGFCIYAFVDEVFARRIFGWQQLGVNRLRAPCAGAGPYVRQLERNELVRHSDCGSQEVSIEYSERVAEAGIAPSVDRKGDSLAAAPGAQSLLCLRLPARWRTAEHRSRYGNIGSAPHVLQIVASSTSRTVNNICGIAVGATVASRGAACILLTALPYATIRSRDIEIVIAYAFARSSAGTDTGLLELVPVRIGEVRFIEVEATNSLIISQIATFRELSCSSRSDIAFRFF